MKSAVSACLLALLALGCGGAPTPFELGEVPSAEELFQEGRQIIEDGGTLFWVMDRTDYEGAIDKFQDIIDNYPYSDFAVLAELEIADIYYAQEYWEEALTYYRDFADLHPEHPKVSHTMFRAALCYFQQSRQPGRDQTFTRQAVAQLEEVLRRFPYAIESGDAEALWRDLRTRLGKHALGIGDFYLARSEWQSAADRYRGVLNEYPGLGLDPEALYKLALCYDQMHRGEEASRIFQVILDNYGDTEVAEAAAELLPAEQVPAAN